MFSQEVRISISMIQKIVSVCILYICLTCACTCGLIPTHVYIVMWVIILIKEEQIV